MEVSSVEIEKYLANPSLRAHREESAHAVPSLRRLFRPALFAFTFAHSQDQPDLIAPTPGAISDSNETTAANPMTITADLTDAPRKLLHAEIEIPVKPGPFTFTAAEWIPGNHSPTGPIGDFAGIFVTGNGQPIAWRCDDVDMYAFHVNVPEGVARLHIRDDFLAVAQGIDVAPNLAEIEWERLMLYPAGVSVNKIVVVPSVIVPSGWRLGTALITTKSSGDSTTFAPTTIPFSPGFTSRRFPSRLPSSRSTSWMLLQTPRRISIKI